MTDLPEISVKTIEPPGFDAATAYAKLRTYTPGRGSFLLESFAPDTPAGRYSVVGYRMRRMELMPPGADAIGHAAGDLEDAPAPASFAAAMAHAMVGYVTASSAFLRLGIGLCSDDGPAAHFLVGTTVMVFDHQRDEVVVAGPTKGNVMERCIWEVTHGPEIEPFPTPAEGGEPEDLRADPADEQLAAKAARAKPFVEDELDSLVLAQTFGTPQGEASPFDAYRALRGLSSAPHGFFIDFGAAPGAPETQIAGVSHEPLHLRRRDGGSTMAAALDEALPHPSTTGTPPAQAAKLIRRLEDNSRQAWGGAVGYLCPGGEAAFMLADQLIMATGGHFWCTSGATLKADTHALTLPAALRDNARVALAAIRAAQLACPG